MPIMTLNQNDTFATICYATFDRNIDKPRPTAIGLESELFRLFLPRALLSMQIQTCAPQLRRNQTPPQCNLEH